MPDVTESGNWERGTGNREPGKGVWERVYSGNPRENSAWRTKEKKREQFGEMWGSVTVVNVSFYRLCHQIMAQYVLVRAESDWYWDKQSMKWRLGWKSNRYYHKLGPQSVRPQSFLNRISSLHSLLISSHFVRELSYQYLKIATSNMISTSSDITHDNL